MEINGEYIKEYQQLLHTTDLQRGYQELLKLFRFIKVYLEKEMPDYVFSGNVSENNMDYAYFQFSDEELKGKGLKFVIAYVHKSCSWEVWLSGVNRKIQVAYYNKLKDTKTQYVLTDNPNKLDYILKNVLCAECTYGKIDKMPSEIKSKVQNFIHDVKSTTLESW